MFNGMRLTDEYDADYFGVQYVYKAGYDVDSYIRFVQRIWAAPLSANGVDVLAFSHSPRASERAKALQHEIADILPQRGEATVSTSALRSLRSTSTSGGRSIPSLRSRNYRSCDGPTEIRNSGAGLAYGVGRLTARRQYFSLMRRPIQEPAIFHYRIFP